MFARNRTELRRTFLLDGLPETLKKSHRHLQITDNYIENTRLRLRKIRAPETKELSYIMQKIFSVTEKKGLLKIAEIYLNEGEYDAFKIFQGREIRKNRYFFESKGKIMEIDIFLGDLQGLIISKLVFDESELEDFEVKPFIIAEITENPVFYGENLVGKTFIDIKAEIERMHKENR